MNERIKLIREALGCSQEQFGKAIGLVKSSISNIESGLRNVTDKHIKLICMVYNVNEEWLREGKGEMFKAFPKESEIDRILAQISASNDSFIKRFIRTYWGMDEYSKTVLKDFFSQLDEN